MMLIGLLILMLTQMPMRLNDADWLAEVDADAEADVLNDADWLAEVDADAEADVLNDADWLC